MQSLAGAAGPAGGEKLDEIRALSEVLPREFPDLRLAVRRPQSYAVAVRSRERDSRGNDPRAADDSALDRFLEIDVDVVFFTHNSRGGDARTNVLQKVGNASEDVDAGRQPLLRGLIALSRNQGEMGVGVDQSRHHIAVA